MSVDLYRGSVLRVSLAGEHIETACGNYLRNITVPDRDTCNLLDLLFPVVIDISWSPADPIAATVGNTTDVTPTVTATNYQVLTGTANDDLTYTIADTDVATVSTQSDKLIITGVSVGSTTLSVTRKNTEIVRVPDTISGTPLTINVT
jgi:hypothetical protein